MFNPMKEPDTYITMDVPMEDPFVHVPKVFLNDPHLSWRAKGIMSYLLGKPSGWKLRVSDLQKHAKEGREAVKTALREFRELGYGALVRNRDEETKLITGSFWLLSAVPKFAKVPPLPPRKKGSKKRCLTRRKHREPRNPSDGKLGGITSRTSTKKDLRSNERELTLAEKIANGFDPKTGEYNF